MIEAKVKNWRMEASCLAVAIVLPSMVTWVYFDWLREQAAIWQQSAYAIGKTLQFAWPLIVTYLLFREKFEWLRPKQDWMGPAVLFGLLVAILIIVAYRGLVLGSPLSGRLIAAANEKVSGLGIGTPVKFATVACFYSLCHSLLEEYYWRWFVFGRAKRLGGMAMAILVSSAGFMAHHVLLLGFFFGFGEWRTWLFSGAIAVGGAYWALVYGRSGNLTASWISHALVDAAIFGLGFFMLFGEGGPVAG